MQMIAEIINEHARASSALRLSWQINKPTANMQIEACSKNVLSCLDGFGRTDEH